jgi:hypothetical protein
MAINRNFLPPMLLAVAAVASIAAAPSVLVEGACPQLSADSTVCESPGNVQISGSPPAQTLPPPYDYLGANGHGQAGAAETFHHGDRRR